MTDINVDKNQIPLKDAIENIYPLLGLLESGFYVILDTTLHPTDGNGGFFWDRQVDVLTKGSCLYYYGDGEWGNLRPYYTIATEPKEKCCKERVEYYRKNPHSRAIAYYMDGYMTALIDGHHKTFAAALQHKDVNALVIVPGHFIYSGKMMKAGYQLAYRMGDMDFNADDLRITEKELKELKDRNRSKQLSSEKALEILNSYYSYKSTFQFPYQTEDLVKWYPTVDEQASIERAGRIDDELLSSILTKEKVCSENEICILMKALAGLKHERLLELGDFFCKQIHSGDTLYVVLESLMTLRRTEQLEQFLLIRWYFWKMIIKQ
jgi:hypothetical protein